METFTLYNQGTEDEFDINSATFRPSRDGKTVLVHEYSDMMSEAETSHDTLMSLVEARKYYLALRAKGWLTLKEELATYANAK
jgi:hypothetical protein